MVLTGSGDDGASGLIAVKTAAGMSLVQDPAEAVHDSMPESAIEQDHFDEQTCRRNVAERPYVYV